MEESIKPRQSHGTRLQLQRTWGMRWLLGSWYYGGAGVNGRRNPQIEAKVFIGYELAPVVAGLEEALVDDGVEAGVFFDEDLAEGAVLAKEDGLEPDQLQ